MLSIYRIVTITTILTIILCTVSIKASENKPLSDLEDKFSDLIFQSSRSIVTIESLHFVNQKPHGNETGDMVQQLFSSGIIYDTTGYIIAAATSVVDSDRLLVHFDKNIIPARMVGIDYHSGLALIEIQRRIGAPAHIGRWQGCAGQIIVALGNSFGVRASPTIGFCAGYRPEGTMQFSAQITSGAIGGGLFDLSGNLVGAITGGIGHHQQAEVGIAVPAANIPGIVDYLIAHGDRPAGYMGISTVDIEITPPITFSLPNRMSSNNMQTNNVIDRGVLVTEVVAYSPAANVGLLKGDLLFSLNGSYIKSALELRQFVRRSKPGSLVEVGFLRNHTPYVVPIQIGRVRLSPSDSFQTPTDESSPDTLDRESLLKEINQLKKSIQQLERRLKNLH